MVADQTKKTNLIRIYNPSDIRREVNKLKRNSQVTEPLEDSLEGPPKGCCKLWIDFSESEVSLDAKIIQACDLATLITKAPSGLRGLRLYDVQVVGDFSLVLQVISNCKTLRDLNCSGHLRQNTADMIALGETLAERVSPRMLRLTLDCKGHTHAAWQILAPILKENNLKELVVYDYNIPPAGDGFLESLDIMARATKLKHLDFGYTKLTAPALEAVTRSVQTMHWLKTLSVKVGTNTNTVALAEALQNHKSMRKLEVIFQIWKENEVKPFLVAIKDHNFQLKNMKLDVDDEPRQFPALLKEINFYTTLNKLGRAKLLSPGGRIMATTKKWMKTISDQDDVSVIHYFLTVNPALCLPDPTYHLPIQEKEKEIGPQEGPSCSPASDVANNAPPVVPECEEIVTDETQPTKKKPTAVTLAEAAPPKQPPSGGASFVSSVAHAAGIAAAGFAAGYWFRGKTDRGN